MKKLKILSIVISFLFASTAYADILVIVHPGNLSQLSVKDVKKIYLGKSTEFPNGEQSVPIDISDGTPAREEFYYKIVGKNQAQLKSYWAHLVFTGGGTPPKAVSTADAVVKLISDNPNMIGYVPDGTNVSSVKVVGKF